MTFEIITCGLFVMCDAGKFTSSLGGAFKNESISKLAIANTHTGGWTSGLLVEI
jgi:hypothetical protein